MSPIYIDTFYRVHFTSSPDIGFRFKFTLFTESVTNSNIGNTRSIRMVTRVNIVKAKVTLVGCSKI